MDEGDRGLEALGGVQEAQGERSVVEFEVAVSVVGVAQLIVLFLSITVYTLTSSQTRSLGVQLTCICDLLVDSA